MPAVVALPSHAFRILGWEQYSGSMDAQMRNAIYGYLAELRQAARGRLHAREVVMPGMARLLRVRRYDFTRRLRLQPFSASRIRLLPLPPGEGRALAHLAAARQIVPRAHRHL